MHCLFTGATLLAMSLLTTARAVASPGTAFSLKQIAVPRDVGSTSGILLARRSRMYVKYGIRARSEEGITAVGGESGSAATSPIEQDQSYLVPVTVGDDTVNLIVDTGSSDLWVFSTLMNNSQSAGHRLYNPRTGKKLEGYSFDITYAGAGSASGEVYIDKAVIGGVTATSQAVEAATSASSNLVSTTNVDGFLGLGFSGANTVSPKPQNTFFDNVSPMLAQKLFTANLKHNAPGEFTFGYIDGSAYTGKLAYTSVNSSADDNWLFQAGGFSVGAGNTKVTGWLGASSADTDGEFLFIPDSVSDAYWAKVPSATYLASEGGYLVPCNATLPDFNIDLGGTLFTVYGHYLNSVSYNSTYCFGGIQGTSGFPFNLFGGVFFEAIYTVFDQTQSSPRLGFGQKELR